MPHSLRKRIVSLIAAVVLFVPGYAGCEGIGHAESGAPVFSSVSEIPGVTEADLAAVRELRDKNESFVYAVNYSTEAFCEQDGTVNGFTALFCEWLSQLFEIPFIPRIVEWDELIDGLENGSIDFTGELTANEERRKKYLMTDDIVQRRIIYIRTDKSLSLQEIANRRDLRYGFLVGATTIEDVRLHEKKSFEEFFADDHREAYEMLLNGTIDAFFEESTAEAAFDFFGEVEVGTFFPIIYSPVSLTTQNQELKIIIDIFQKALDNGAINYLTEIYNRGHFEYTRQKFRLLLTDEERDYIAKNPVINYGAEIANYPVSFFNDRTRKFEGIAHDVINELEKLTGLVFLRANDELTHWPELLQMLDDGEVAMITELIPSEDRIGNYRWAGVSFFQSHLILISKTEHHDIEANEILYVKTGLSKNTGHSILFKQWFPNHRAIVEYPNTTEALNALERGEVDMVMTSEHQLLIMTNYRELVGYKANFVFEYYFDSTFGFGYEEENLSAIMTKAMRLVDINGISGRWMRRTYDYRVQLAQDRILFVIAGGALLLGFLFMFMQLIRKRKEGKKLESLVEKRTKELSENQNRLQDSLRHNEYQLLKLNLMVKATKIGLWDMYIKRDDPVNPSNEIAWSDEFRKMLGYKNEIDFPNIFGSLITRLHPADVSKIIASFVEHINDAAANAPYDVEYRAQRKNGEYGYFRATGETIRDNAGRPVRITGAMLDITETKKLLIDLETESSMLQTMFNSVPDLIFCKDMNLKYTRCNESLLKYFNLKESDLIGSTDEEGLRITSESAMQYHVSDKAVIESNRIVTYEEYVPNFEGVVRLFETNKVPLMFNGKVTGIMGIARDITERKAMEEAAQAANQAKTAFLANMSHEIRTPMNAIIGMSNILCHEDLSQRQMGYVNDISVSAQSLLGIINDILDMSKIEAGKLELIPIDYNFDQFFDNIVSMFTLVASNKGLDFFSEKIGILPVFLYGDDIRLRQVLTNICGNAVKFTANGYVKLSAFASDGMLNFKIEDTGAGIKKDDVPNLFKAFEQADKSRNRNVVGTGLGLPISKSFVEMMGGKITVESEYGHGTAFTVTVPVVEGNAENIAEKKTAETYTEIYAPDASILITDDNEFNLKVASGLMGFMDIEADLADSGFKAIKMVQQKDYDIVFMDHMMPEMDGIETAQRIRQLGGKHEKLVIVALTANAVKGAKEMFIESGFDDFITKPIDSNELRELIVKHLPPEKIKTVNDTDTDTKLSRLLKQDELIRKAIITFVKENAATAEKIKAALGANDTKTAHRIAHTLKSSAGFLRKTELQEAALSLESSLQRDKPVFTEEQIHLIEKELAKAFDEFEPVMAEAESAKGEASQISAEEMASLLAEIRPLIEKGEFGATAYVERLQHITGLEELAEKLDDYDFENALIILDSLKFDN